MMRLWRRGTEGRSWIRETEWTLFAWGNIFLAGWWSLRWWGWFALSVSLGGENNLLELKLGTPLSRGAIGLRVPRWLTRSWVYQEREWAVAVGYVGSLLEVRFGFDYASSDMGGYLVEKGYRRLLAWPGWRLRVPGPGRWARWVLGPEVASRTVVSKRRVLVPMPEGLYPGVVRIERVPVWKRPRWPGKRVRVWSWIRMEVPVPVPGKGENSWDQGDDAIGATGGGKATVESAVAAVVESALRIRSAYGGEGWVPEKGWPAGMLVREGGVLRRG